MIFREGEGVVRERRMHKEDRRGKEKEEHREGEDKTNTNKPATGT